MPKSSTARTNETKVVPITSAPTPAKKYEPSPKELASIEAYSAKKKARKPRPRMKPMEGDNAGLSINHPQPQDGWMLLMESIGTTDVEITKLITQQLGEITQDNRKFDIQKLNYALALVQAVEPRDEMETMLATQMAAIHLATMVQARRLQGAESVQQAEANSKSLNALARTFAQQMETLKKYRGGNQQKVVVEHVHVYSGGQAVVGAVNAKEGAPA